MVDLVNPALVNLQALFVDNSDSHARRGAHIRVNHHPVFGLPMMPFILQRADVSLPEMGRLKLRETAIFRDQTGQQRGLPFSIDKGDEITVTLPLTAGELALWAELIIDPGSPLPGQTSAITVEAHVRSATQGTAHLGSRSDGPFAFTASGLVRFVIRGRGTIAAIRWLESTDEQKLLRFFTTDVLNLPHPGGPRYLELSPWEDLCETRITDQRPRRQPLHELDRARPRFTAPGFSDAEEADRIQALFNHISDPLDRLITDPKPQHDQNTRHVVTNPDGQNIMQGDTETAEATFPSLGLMFQSTVDPGLASWMGYKTLDTDNNTDDQQRLSIYRLIAILPNPTQSVIDTFAEDDPLLPLAIGVMRRNHSVLSTDALFQTFEAEAGPYLRERGILFGLGGDTRFGFAFHATAVADHFAPLDPLTPPRPDTPTHVNWGPSPLDAPLRATDTGVRGIIAGGALAAHLRSPASSGDWRTLNRKLPGSQWHTLIAATPPGEEDTITTTPPPDTILTDTQTGPDDIAVHVAQMDRFGRFSDFANRTGAPGPRPRPPRPTLLASYAQAEVTTPPDHRGRITVTVPMPEESALAPGAFPLDRVEIDLRVEDVLRPDLKITLQASDAVSIHPHSSWPLPAPTPANPNPQPPAIPPGEDQTGLRITIDGPNIPPQQSRKLTLEARWVDTANQPSARSEPTHLQMSDPYPPAQISSPDVLDYSARPDATGAAWVERGWQAQGTNTRHAVYYTDENRLRDFLRKTLTPANTALLTALEAEPDPAARATRLRAANDTFPDHLFERLKDVIDTSATPQISFRHALPGSLRVLSGYKIATESAETGARPNLAGLDTVYFAVPNADPPPRPTVMARLVAPNPGEPDLVAEITVTLRPGLTEGRRARIRRTRSGVIDPLRNPVLGTVDFGPVDPDTGLQTATFRDLGAALVAPAARFAPFVSYAWIAEAQGPEEPGSAASANGSVQALWSEASPPATLDTVPDAPPVAPILLGRDATTVAGGFSNVSLAFDYPIDLVPAHLGAWHIRVERALPSSGLQLMGETPALPGTRFTVAGDPDQPDRVLPTGTRFRIRVIDPIGRESPPVEQILQ